MSHEKSNVGWVEYFDNLIWYGCIGLLLIAVGLNWSVLHIPPDLPRLQSLWDSISSSVSTLELAAYCISPYVVYWVLCAFTVRYVYDRTLENGGFMPKNLQNRWKISGPVPPPFPNGWFCVALSHEVHKGDVKQISVLGKEFALYRGEDGKCRVVDAFCPHLGANLSIDGVVKKDCIECPFHGWSFRGDTGECAGIVYSQNIPSTAKIGIRPCVEANGSIYIWYHVDGIEPTWDLPAPPRLNSWKQRFDGFSRHEISAHIQEVPENGADVAHLNHLHTNPAVVRFLGMIGLVHYWEAHWKPLTDDKAHMTKIDLVMSMRWFGWTIPGTTLQVEIYQYGPGIVILQFNSKIGHFYIVQSVTPMEPMRQKVIHAVYGPWFMPRIISKGLLVGTVDQVERDIPIWNNKTYVPKPMLAKGDGRISQFRSWFSQFYTKEQLEAAKTKSCVLDW